MEDWPWETKSVLTSFTAVDDHRPAVEGSIRSPGTSRLRSSCTGWSTARSPSWGLERRWKMAARPTADLAEWVAGVGRGEPDRPIDLAARGRTILSIVYFRHKNIL